MMDVGTGAILRDMEDNPAISTSSRWRRRLVSATANATANARATAAAIDCVGVPSSHCGAPAELGGAAAAADHAAGRGLGLCSVLAVVAHDARHDHDAAALAVAFVLVVVAVVVFAVAAAVPENGSFANRHRAQRLRRAGTHQHPTSTTTCSASESVFISYPNSITAMEEAHPWPDVVDRYSLSSTIGQGGFSTVWRATEYASGSKVAVKKLYNVFRSANVAKRVLREIKLLKHFRGHENIITLLDLPIPSNPKTFNDVYIVFELATTDLSNLIISRKRISEEHIRLYMYQIIRGLKYLHSGHVIHRDLKPLNILIQTNNDLKICDLNSGRSEHALTLSLLEETTTRYYCPPEGLCCSTNYTPAVDMWCAGCIMGEMILRKPLFQGHTNYDVLKSITTLLGTPVLSDIDSIEDDMYRKFVKYLPAKPKIPLSETFSHTSPQALELLDKLLQFNPAKRVSAKDALEMPFFTSLHDPSDEPVALPFEDDDIGGRTAEYYREEIFKSIVQFRAPCHKHRD
ncbi:CMGC/MAPK protein kinase [Pelomyxa schiedti]|nr:CMGC/MAPK protein kinase [Pelomyxa schiedti]